MCELNENIFIEFALLGQAIDKCQTKLESCGIGNQAKIILTFDRFQVELKNKLALEFFTYVKRIKAQLKRE